MPAFEACWAQARLQPGHRRRGLRRASRPARSARRRTVRALAASWATAAPPAPPPPPAPPGPPPPPVHRHSPPRPGQSGDAGHRAVIFATARCFEIGPPRSVRSKTFLLNFRVVVRYPGCRLSCVSRPRLRNSSPSQAGWRRNRRKPPAALGLASRKPLTAGLGFGVEERDYWQAAPCTS